MVRSIQSLLWKLAQAGVLIALFTGSSSAQMPAINLAPTDRQLTPEEVEKRRTVDDSYKSAIKKIPDQKHIDDPWGNLRSNTPASPKTKQ
jgi:hypothetical protein